MPWRVETPLSQRQDFVEAMARGHWQMTELCARFGISRKTGYQWWARYDQGGVGALGDQSRRPRTSPTALDGPMAGLVVRTRQAHPTWGPRKLLAYLSRRHPRQLTPPSTRLPPWHPTSRRSTGGQRTGRCRRARRYSVRSTRRRGSSFPAEADSSRRSPIISGSRRCSSMVAGSGGTPCSGRKPSRS